MCSDQGHSSIPLFVLHWNRPAECINTIKIIQNQTLSTLITVIDNGSDTSNLTQLQNELPPEVSLKLSETNLGWGPGFNLALTEWLDHGSTEMAIICAHDAILERDCIQRLVRSCTADAKIGICSTEYGEKELTTYSSIRGATVRASSGSADGFTRCAYAHGTVMLFRRDCLKQIGVFDERFFAYGDEVDICLRAAKAGWKVGVVFGAIVRNPITVAPNDVIAFLWSRNMLLLSLKHGGPVHCAVRLILSVCNSILIYLRETFFPSGNNYGARARLRGALSFLQGRFGAPPNIRVPRKQ